MTSFHGAIVNLPNPLSNTKQNSATTNLAHSLQHGNANDEIEAIETKLGISTGHTGEQVAAASTVMLGTAGGISWWGAVDTARLAAAAVSQIGSDTGSGDTNTGTTGVLANITSCVVALTMTSGGGKGIAILTGSFTDTIDATDIALGINITGIGDVSTGVAMFAQQGANRRMLGHWVCAYSGLSGAVTFQARFGRSGAAGTLTAQQTRLDVIEFKR